MFSRGRRSLDLESMIQEARSLLQDVVSEQTASHTDEIRRVLAYERAESISQLAAEERRLADERRAGHAERERQAGEQLAETLAASERRLEERLRGFTDDLERTQRHLAQQVQSLEERRKRTLDELEQRFESEAAELGSTADEQRRTVARLREELERAAGQAVTDALDELETQTQARRRAVEEITEKMRGREAAVAESIERAEQDARGRIDVMLAEWERRQSERLERVMEREIERHVQVAMLAYDERLREVREDALAALRRELDRAVDMLSRAELARRLEEPTDRDGHVGPSWGNQ